MGRFYRDLADNIDNFLVSDFYGQITNDYNIPSEDVQKYILATSSFAKGMQTDINHCVTKDRINNASFRQKLDPISKNILRRQNLLEFIFEDISTTFDAENPIVDLLFKELDVSKKDLACKLIKKAPRPPDLDYGLRNRLEKLNDIKDPFNNDNNNNLSPPPSPLPLSSFLVPPPPKPPQPLLQPPPPSTFRIPPPPPPHHHFKHLSSNSNHYLVSFNN